jgi:hypothetical protein
MSAARRGARRTVLAEHRVAASDWDCTISELPDSQIGGIWHPI